MRMLRQHFCYFEESANLTGRKQQFGSPLIFLGLMAVIAWCCASLGCTWPLRSAVITEEVPLQIRVVSTLCFFQPGSNISQGRHPAVWSFCKNNVWQTRSISPLPFSLLRAVNQSPIISSCLEAFSGLFNASKALFSLCVF